MPIIRSATVERMKTCVASVLNMVLVCCACGCSSAPTAAPQTPASSPATIASKSESKPATEPTAQSQPAGGSAEPATVQQAQATETSTTTDGLRKASRPPVELITLPGTLFVFNFGESEVGKTAKERCAKATGTANETAACLQKARDKVPVESVRFVKKGTEHWWITLNRYKGNLLKWHIIQFQVGEETDDRVTLKPIGKDKGIAPMVKLPRSLQIELPNDYSIVMNDPEYGKMTFDAKFGKIEE